MTVAQLRKRLEKFPDDYEVVMHDKDAVWDSKVVDAYIHPYDKKKRRKVVTIGGK